MSNMIRRDLLKALGGAAALAVAPPLLIPRPVHAQTAPARYVRPQWQIVTDSTHVAHVLFENGFDTAVTATINSLTVHCDGGYAIGFRDDDDLAGIGNSSVGPPHGLDVNRGDEFTPAGPMSKCRIFNNVTLWTSQVQMGQAFNFPGGFTLETPIVIGPARAILVRANAPGHSLYTNWDWTETPVA